MNIKIEVKKATKARVGDIIIGQSPFDSPYLLCKENHTGGKYYARSFDGECLANSYHNSIEELIAGLERNGAYKYEIYSKNEYELKLVKKGE